MSQYALPITLAPVFSADNFYISASNEQAHRQVLAWPQWPGHALVLSGPKGSGKSHLAHVWAAASGAVIVAAAALDAFIPVSQPVLVEDIGQLASEEALLHLFNHVRENQLSLLMTSDVAPVQLALALPDLSSRLLATPLATIGAPDDALLAGAMRKQFSDRQMKVDEEVIAYLLPRIERSLESVHDMVQTLDQQALEHKRNLTIPFIKQLLN